MREIKLPFSGTLFIEKDFYKITGPGVYLVSLSLSHILEKWLNVLARQGVRRDETETIEELIHQLQIKRMYFLGRIEEVLSEIPADIRDELLDEINEEMEDFNEEDDRF